VHIGQLLPPYEKLHLELEKEKQRRVLAELKLQDYMQEHQEPFMVPALLEACAFISELTTQACA
jgi:hypothetical protein